MKKMITRVAIVCASLILISIILWLVFPSVYFFYLMAPPWQGMKQMEKDFQQNEELITSVKNYLAESEYDDIFITDSMARGQMFVNIVGQSYATIDNEEIIDAIRQLKKHGYS